MSMLLSFGVFFCFFSDATYPLSIRIVQTMYQVDVLASAHDLSMGHPGNAQPPHRCVVRIPGPVPKEPHALSTLSQCSAGPAPTCGSSVARRIPHRRSQIHWAASEPQSARIKMSSPPRAYCPSFVGPSLFILSSSLSLSLALLVCPFSCSQISHLLLFCLFMLCCSHNHLTERAKEGKKKRRNKNQKSNRIHTHTLRSRTLRSR